jgi:hypothetical protein
MGGRPRGLQSSPADLKGRNGAVRRVLGTGRAGLSQVGVPGELWSCADLQRDIETAGMQVSAGDTDERPAGQRKRGDDRRAAVSWLGDQQRRCDAVIEREQEPAREPIVDHGRLGAEPAAPRLGGQIHAARTAGRRAGLGIDLIDIGCLASRGVRAGGSV